MNKLDFIKNIDAGSEAVTDKTADLWYHIFDWIQVRGYADIADTPEFVDYVRRFRKVEVTTLAKHLGRMAKANILRAHTVRRRLPESVKEELATSMSGMIFGGNASAIPSTFKRYTLPNSQCPLEFKTANELIKRNRQLDGQLREQSNSTFG